MWGLRLCRRYYSAWQEEGYLYIKMEVCNGGNLLQYISREYSVDRRIPSNVLWDWCAQTANGLRFLHACNFVHLDVKPDNIFVYEHTHSPNSSTASNITAPGARNITLKIGDLGLACPKGYAKYETNGDSRYVAPELVADSTVRLAASDVFSLGMSMLQLSATIVLPREGAEWTRLRQGRWLPTSKFDQNDIPPPMVNLIRVMISATPQFRPTSAEVLRFCTAQLALIEQSTSVVGQQETSLVTAALRCAQLAPKFLGGRVLGTAGSVLFVLREADRCARRSCGAVTPFVAADVEDVIEEDISFSVESDDTSGMGLLSDQQMHDHHHHGRMNQSSSSGSSVQDCDVTRFRLPTFNDAPLESPRVDLNISNTSCISNHSDESRRGVSRQLLLSPTSDSSISPPSCRSRSRSRSRSSSKRRTGHNFVGENGIMAHDPVKKSLF